LSFGIQGVNIYRSNDMQNPTTTAAAIEPTPATTDRRRLVISWVLRLTVAAILFQTLFFKFSAAPESVYIFSRLGMEPWGRIGSGVAELIACGLVLWTPTAGLGAALALLIISGALVSHLTKLGVVVQNDGGLLFVLAVVVFGTSAALVAMHRRSIIPPRFRRS
jgi:hypothetical protein